MKSTHKCFILLNHQPGDEQMAELRKRFAITEFLYPTEEFQSLWSNLQPESGLELVQGIREWLANESQEADYLWIQGEWGLCFYLVCWGLSNKRIPIYASSRRQAVEKKLDNGTIQSIRKFKHVTFKHYKIDE